MLFTEPVFLFLFLPLLLPLNVLAGRRFGNAFLIAAGLVFYFTGEKSYVLVLMYCIGLNWTIGALMARHRPGIPLSEDSFVSRVLGVFGGAWRPRPAKNQEINSRTGDVCGAGQPCPAAEVRAGEGHARKLLLALGIIGNLAPLAVFKYSGFAAGNLNVLLSAAGAAQAARPEMHIPLGLSFFTFQSMAYIIDVYRRDVAPARRASTYALYLTLFPHLIAGPIVRYRDISAQLARRALTRADFAEGARRFVVGLGKKRLIADTLAMRSDRIFAIPAEQLTTPVAWLGAACYMLQIYFDFSGYSDMAIGLARMLGFTFLENFNYPYAARSVTEFWRRWHISLSTWFRDYLYIPLGGNRAGPARVYFNLITVFVLCGFWHGAKWTFMIWGLYHGAFMILERAGFSLALSKRRAPGHAYTVLVVMIGWVFFRSGTLGYALAFVAAMFGFAHGSGVEFHAGLYFGWDLALALVAGAIGSAPVFPALAARMKNAVENRPASAATLEAAFAAAGILALALVFLAVAMSVAGETYRPFLYSRF